MSDLTKEERLTSILSKIGVDSSFLSEIQRRELQSRINLYDITGISAILGLSRDKASILILKLNDVYKNFRKVLGTRDSRRLRSEIAEIFSARASTRFAAAMLSLLSPSLSKQEIMIRQQSFRMAIEVHSKLQEAGILNKVREMLKEIRFESGKSLRAADYDVLDYFSCRIRAIAMLVDILRLLNSKGIELEFLPSGSLTSLQAAASLMLKSSSEKRPDPESVISDAELEIDEELRRGNRRGDEAILFVQQYAERIASQLRLSEDEFQILNRAVAASTPSPFTFDRIEVRKLVQKVRRRQDEEERERKTKIESQLKSFLKDVDESIEGAVKLDLLLSVADICKDFNLTFPNLDTQGIAFVEGRNILLMQSFKDSGKSADAVQPVSYSVGRTHIGDELKIKNRNVAMLTGANSGGKTTLLNTLACIAIMSMLGLPVPAKRAEVQPLPIYIFKRRVTRKIGSLEQALRSLIPVFSLRPRKVVLMDEFEALTEPGAAGRILAAIVNLLAPTSSLMLLITHLSRETLPHVRFPIRVDGIEAKGLDSTGELLVDRQPIFGHIGSSTPQLVVMKLMKKARKNDRQLYENLLLTLQSEGGMPVQTPISIPWLEKK